MHIHKANTYKVHTLLNHRVENFCMFQYMKESYNTFSLFLATAESKYCKFFILKDLCNRTAQIMGYNFINNVL